MQRNAQGVHLLRQYRCQQGYQKLQAFFTFFRCWNRNRIYISKTKGFLWSPSIFRKWLFAHYIDQALESDGEKLVDYVVPRDVSGHKKESKEVPVAERGITLQHSMHIFELTKNLVPVGSGKWLQCLFSLYAKINIRIASHFRQDTWREITDFIS